MPTMSQSTDAEGKFKAVLIALKVSTVSLILSELFHCCISTLGLIVPAQCDYELKSKHRTWAQKLILFLEKPHTNLKSAGNYMLTQAAESIFRTFETFIVT